MSGEGGNGNDLGEEIYLRENIFFLNDMIYIISKYKLKLGAEDNWRWRHSRNEMYTTKDAYLELTK